MNLLDDGIDLHRLIWYPDDYDGEQLLTTAFRREDLLGGGEYLSVSCTDRLEPEIEREIACQQAERANGIDIFREEPYSTLFNCGRLRNKEDVENCTPFDVTRERTDENPAHCGIRNVSGKRNNSYINQLRTLLVELASSPRTLDCFLRDFEEH